MRIVIAEDSAVLRAGLERLLADRGDRPAGIIRRPEQAQDLVDAGAEPLVLDLESATAPQLAALLADTDAVVFAAGAGPGSGAARKNTVDRDAAVLLADAAELAVRRYLMVSSMGADAAAHHPDEVFETYLRAKGAADDAVRSRTTLDWTVLRPGSLTDGPGTGLVRLAPSVGRGTVDRADVAAVLAALLREPGTAGQTLELVAGNATVAKAVAAAAGHDG